MIIEAAVWSTAQVRSMVRVDASQYSPTNERPGCDGERIVDFGPHIGLIISTHWGPTPFGQALSGMKIEKEFDVEAFCKDSDPPPANGEVK